MLHERDLSRADIKRWVRQGKSIKCGDTWYTVLRSSNRAGKLMLVTADWELQRGKKQSSKLLTHDELLQKVNNGTWMVKINDKPVGATVNESKVKNVALRFDSPEAAVAFQGTVATRKGVGSTTRSFSAVDVEVTSDAALKHIALSAYAHGGRIIVMEDDPEETTTSSMVGGFVVDPIGIVFPKPFGKRRRRKKKMNEGKTDSLDKMGITLDADEASILSAAINAFGEASHPLATTRNVGGFTKQYVLTVLARARKKGRPSAYGKKLIASIAKKLGAKSIKERRSKMNESVVPSANSVKSLIKKLGLSKYVKSVGKRNGRMVIPIVDSWRR